MKVRQVIGEAGMMFPVFDLLANLLVVYSYFVLRHLCTILFEKAYGHAAEVNYSISAPLISLIFAPGVWIRKLN